MIFLFCHPAIVIVKNDFCHEDVVSTSDVSDATGLASLTLPAGMGSAQI